MFKYQTTNNLEGLKARKEVLTATEAVSLLPAMRKYKRSKNKVIPDKFYQMIATKLDTSEPELITYNAAARGHVLEPYAVEQGNIDHMSCNKMYHGDDCIICNSDGLGFSPDALSIKQPDNCPVRIDTDGDTAPYAILEIKSYGAEHHIVSCMTRQNQLPERYQIAAAMVVEPAINCGRLYFYNPNVTPYGGAGAWSREELEAEIEEIKCVCKIYKLAQQSMEERIDGASVGAPERTESEIYQEWLASQNENDIIKGSII